MTDLRAKFEKEFTKIGEDLIHMLRHISEIETQMLSETDTLIKDAYSNRGLNPTREKQQAHVECA